MSNSPYPKLKGFKIGHLNIPSQYKHIEELRILLSEQPFDIICINETRLDGTIPDEEVEITGYEIVRVDRNRNGGGVAIYIKNNISYNLRENIIPDEAEAICLEVKKPKTKSFLISTWYRPPNLDATFYEKFEYFLRKADDENLEIVITGDFICTLLKTEYDSDTIKLKDLFDICELQQHILKPTRITTTTQSLIDLILTKLDDTKTIDSGVMHVGISDHSLVYICRKASIPKETSKLVETRQFKNFNAIHFQNDLKHSFNELYHHTNPNTAWNYWKETFLKIADTHAPIRTKKVKNKYKPWLTNDIKNMSHRRDYLKIKAVKYNSIYHETYKNCRNQVNKLIKEVKAKYFKSNLENCKNSKESWKL